MSTSFDLGRQLYTTDDNQVKPSWEQIGDKTRSVWVEMAKLKQAGNPLWWSRAASAPRFRGARQELIHMTQDINHADVADILLEIGTLFSKLSSSFRGGTTPTVGGTGDETAAKPVRTRKSASTGKPPPAKVEEGSGDELDIDAVRSKLKELVESKGKDKMVEALESVGAGKLADVDESQYQELVDKAQKLIDEEDEPAPKAKGVTLEELTAAAKGLIAADKAAFTKLSKKFGKPSECDEDQYPDYLKAIQEAMSSEESDEEEDLL